jgi:hypothetical protein
VSNIIHSQPQEMALVSNTKATIAHIKAIKEIMKQVMVEGVHYGVIPGCDKPSLYKPGSEVLLTTFKISIEPEVREIRGDDITYQVRCIGKHIQTGMVIGVGIGECSTAEDKYRWRAAICQEEFDATPEDMRRVKWNKGKYDQNSRTYGKAWTVNQVRTNPADLANTALKLAKKRAQIDMCLTGLSASDIFTQDVEDLPPELLDENGLQIPAAQQKNKKNIYKEKEKTGQPQFATEAQIRLLRSRLPTANKTEVELCVWAQIESIESLPRDKVNNCIDWLSGKTQ